MKCVKEVHGENSIRVSDAVAAELVADGTHVYVSKAVWKLAGRKR